MNRQSPRIYRLDGIEIDTSQVCLKRNGEEQHVRQKTFQVLVYLLEQRRRLVTKEELIEHIWQGAAVTDNTLEQCLAEIRKVLGDDSRHPRFVKTVPRSGYRFIGSVEEGSPDQPAKFTSSDFKSERTVKDPSVGDIPLVRSKALRAVARRRVVILSAVILIIMFGVGWYLIRRHSSAASSLSVTLPQDASRRPVAVMFLDNQSGSADLDWLREGLADMIITDLSRSRQIAVLSRQQLHVLLDRIGHKEAEKIRIDEALEIAQKCQAKIVILGSFVRLGEQIRIDVHLHDARDGQLLTAERLVVDHPGEILTEVDLLSLKLSSYLTASSAKQEASASLASVMTNNLEAYRYYSLGVEKANALHTAEAIDLFEKAIALDAEFAMAYARIGNTYVSSNRVDMAKPYLVKAFQLSGRLTEKDKLYITAWYALSNLDNAAAIKSFQEIVAHYPLEVEAYRRLAALLQGEERFEESIEVLKQALIIDSEAKELYNSLGGSYLDLGRHDEAIAMYQHYVALAPEEPNAHDSLGAGYQWAGRYPEAIAEYQRALALKPDFEFPIIHLGNTYFQQGRYEEAIQQYQRYIRIVPSEVNRARGYNSIAHIERLQGKLNEADRSANTAVKYSHTSVNQLFLIALENKDLATATKFKDVMESGPVLNRGAKGFVRELLCYRGLLAMKSGHTAEAIDNFKDAMKHRPLIWNIDPMEDCLANAYLELGRLDEAIAEYERILRLNPNYPLVRYHLAQAYERKGLRDQARAEYERFLQVWKDADGNIPAVVGAKKALSG